MSISNPFAISFAFLFIGCSAGVFPAWEKTIHHMGQSEKNIRVEKYLDACGIDSLPPINTRYYNSKRGIVVGHVLNSDDIRGIEIIVVDKSRQNSANSAETPVEFLRGPTLSIDYSDSGILDVWHWRGESINNRELVYWYFNRQEWIRSIEKQTGSVETLPDERTDPDAIKQYYIMLQPLSYGWYSNEDFEYTAQREALFSLLNQRQFGLIRQLMYVPNIISRVYAAEALLYLEREGQAILPEDRQAIGQLFSDNPTIKMMFFSGVSDDFRKEIPFREIFTEKYISDTIPFMYKISIKQWFQPYKPVYLFPFSPKF